MDSIFDKAINVLEKYNTIEINNTDNISITFSIRGVRFRLWLLDECNTTMPLISVLDEKEAYPHFLLKEYTFSDASHRIICLYENDSIISFLLSVEEKVEFLIDQLINLIKLSPNEIEKEFQKEFTYYWNNCVTNRTRYELYLKNDNQFSWLKIYDYKGICKRIVHPQIKFNMYHNEDFLLKIPAIYIPIIDSRGILPPTLSSPWMVKDLLNIIDNVQQQKISYDVYSEIINTSYSKKTIILVFKMYDISFACEVEFCNAGTAKLIEKIRNNVKEIRPLKINRCDFMYLNYQIGNDLSLNNKKIAIVGVGALGSYVARELVKSGVKNLVLVDNDIFYSENVMRHSLGFSSTEVSKVNALKVDLEYIHPEVLVETIQENISGVNSLELIPSDTDAVIFTVGSSDVQIECNRVLKMQNYEKPILFCWIEGNGVAGHVLGINYAFPGCFECLFTDEEGDRINNKINSLSNDIKVKVIRNGCGGTRVAYGNTILLQTTSIVLMAVNKIFSVDFNKNFLYNFSNLTITELDDEFFMKGCPCCNGNRE